MITAQQIKDLAEPFLDGTSGFLVDVQVSEGNMIKVLLDNDESTSIEDCMSLSRHLESLLDRDDEDFSLDVSSPGLDQPLRFDRQYRKNIGRVVEVKPTGAGKVEGKLTAVEADEIELTIREKRRIEGRKAKEWVEEKMRWRIQDLDWTKVTISFK
ncbi:MAG: ribosome assembly cofactor RimP [Flavobacteriales bacterium]